VSPPTSTGRELSANRLAAALLKGSLGAVKQEQVVGEDAQHLLSHLRGAPTRGQGGAAKRPASIGGGGLRCIAIAALTDVGRIHM
jgi:hypothetical protein